MVSPHNCYTKLQHNSIHLPCSLLLEHLPASKWVLGISTSANWLFVLLTPCLPTPESLISPSISLSRLGNTDDLMRGTEDSPVLDS